LKKLDLSGSKKLANLHNDIAALKSLEEINLNDAAFMGLPSQLGDLKALRKIHFARQPLQTFDCGLLVSLDHLRTLDLSGLKIPNLPWDFDRVKQVEELILASMDFEMMPPSLYNLPQLKILNLNNCAKLKDINSAIAAWVNLEELHLDGYIDKGLPIEIGLLPKLRALSVANSKLTGLPLSICQPPLKMIQLKGSSALQLLGDLKVDAFDGQGGDVKALQRAYKAEALKTGAVRLHVISGKGLMAADPNGKSDPYCIV